MKSLSQKADLLEYTSLIKIDGVAHLFNSKSNCATIKCIWLCILLTFSCLCVYLIVNSIKEYNEYRVTTTYRLVTEQEAAFPSVHICNLNPFNTEYAIAFINLFNSTLPAVIEAGRQNLSPMDLDYNLLAFESTYMMMQTYSKQTEGSYLTDAQKRRLSDLESILIDCEFDGRKCNASDFKWHFHNAFFGCYQFNAGRDESGNQVDVKKVAEAGLTNNRLSLQFYVGSSSLLDKLLPLRGIVVRVFNATDNPLQLTPSPSMLLPGIGTSIGVRRYFYNQYPSKYSECTVSESGELLVPLDDSKFFDTNKLLQGNYTYSRIICLFACYQHYIKLACNCTLSNMPNGGADEEKCMTVEKYNCAYRYFTQKISLGDFTKSNCLPKCPLECNNRILATTFSSFNLSLSKAQVQKYESIYGNQSGILENLVEVSVYYDSLSYTIVDEKPKMTFENLVGSIGGHLHLFLGMSLMSFFEVFELIVRIFIHVTCKL